MTKLPFSLTVGAVLGLAVAAVHPCGLPAEEATCGDHGTAVVFVDSPAEAAKQALKQEKLVFVLHVSGHFEVPDYT